MTANGHGASFGSDDDVLELDRMGAGTALNILKATQFYTLKRSNWYVLWDGSFHSIKRKWTLRERQRGESGVRILANSATWE